MQLVYNGAHPEVVVDELDSGQVIAAGQPVEIRDDLAARLLEQDTWALAKTAAAPTPAPSTPDVTVNAAPDTTTKGNN